MGSSLDSTCVESSARTPEAEIKSKFKWATFGGEEKVKGGQLDWFIKPSAAASSCFWVVLGLLPKMLNRSAIQIVLFYFRPKYAMVNSSKWF